MEPGTEPLAHSVGARAESQAHGNIDANIDAKIDAMIDAKACMQAREDVTDTAEAACDPVGTFAVTLETVSEISAHPTVGHLVSVRVEGKAWVSVDHKNTHKIGDRVVFFPLDALIPPKLITSGKMPKFLHKAKPPGRVRTTDVSGVDSQCAMAPAANVLGSDWQSKDWPHNLAKCLGVKKWPGLGHDETSPKEGGGGGGGDGDGGGGGGGGDDGKDLPRFLSAYRLEHSESNTRAVKMLMEQRVHISEKIEGTNYSITLRPNTRSKCGESVAAGTSGGGGRGGSHDVGVSGGGASDSDFDVIICSRNQKVYTLAGGIDSDPKASKNNKYVQATRELKLSSVVRRIQTEQFPGQTVTLYGELIGPSIEGNFYETPTLRVLFFDILVDGRFQDIDVLGRVCAEYALSTAPEVASDVVLREWVGDSTLAAASNGPMALKLGSPPFGLEPIPEEKEARKGVEASEVAASKNDNRGGIEAAEAIEPPVAPDNHTMAVIVDSNADSNVAVNARVRRNKKPPRSRRQVSIREGIVIRPMKEGVDGKGRRLIVKQKSPEYLKATGL